MPDTVTLSLISHTNVGKTTLARTLLRRDVGEVLDQAHVTEISESHALIETPRAVLRLWDTPGFGDLTRLVARLRREQEPLGRFLHDVWDRFVNRPLWCSQEAARNVKNEADVVLYLVNASEDPEDAGYVPPELELLGWIGRPVVLLLNQVGTEGRDLEARWRDFVRPWPVVREVLSLDAFTRCWVEESVLLERVVEVLDPAKREAMEELADAWKRRNLEVFESCCKRMAAYVARAATDREAPGTAPRAGDLQSDSAGMLEQVTQALTFGAVDKKRAMTALNERLDGSTAELMEGLIAGHGLYGESAAKIEERIRDFQVRGLRPLTEGSGALTGAVVSGALGGLAADALSGGLSLGGGMIAGAILGALGGAALARGYRWVGGQREPSVQWSPRFLDELTRQVILRYFAVAHFGRGRGAYRDIEQPAHWSAAVERGLERHRRAMQSLWEEAGRPRAVSADRLDDALRAILGDVIRDVLGAAYPHAARGLRPREAMPRNASSKT